MPWAANLHRSNRLAAFRLAGICLLLSPVVSGCFTAALLGGGSAAASSAAFDERTVGEHVDDIALAGRIKASLISEKDLPARWVGVEVIDGRAVLTGYLPKTEQIRRARRISEQIKGVKSVESRIKLGAPTASEMLSDSWITAKVKSKLLDDPLTPGFSIHVETVNGEVYLQGRVKTSTERHRAVDVAASVDGVASVSNMLRVGP